MRYIVYDAIVSYEYHGSDLVLVFEMDSQVENIVNELISTGYCKPTYDTYVVDGIEVRMCRLFVHRNNIDRFQDASFVIVDFYDYDE